MKRNRRNYYRILHVQPEAPLELIKASYRTLMGPLRNHPDLGGDHEAAALLNEAYAVLSDPAKRAAYDRTVAKERWRIGLTGAAPSQGLAHPAAQGDPGWWQTEQVCPFCRVPLSSLGGADPRCARCDAPLVVPPAPESSAREFFGKRRSARFTKNRSVRMQSGWGLDTWTVTMRDLSLTGVCVVASAALPVGQVVRLVDPDFEAVAVVVSSRRTAGAFALHAQFLTFRPDRDGVLVTARV